MDRFAAMRFPAFLATALLLSTPLAEAAEQSFPAGPGVVTLSGKCAELQVGKINATKGCRPELASVTLVNGEVTFIFTSGGKMLGFQGDGTAIKAAGKGSVRLPLTLVSTGVAKKMTGQVKVSGSCSFGNPFGGKPVEIECSAKSSDTAFTARFRTDGKPPHKH